MDLLENKGIVPVNIEEQMKEAYIDYAMSVIVGRALPEVKDGLKPVHRKILYAMSELSLWPDKPHRKSARIVGDVLGKYHPHGDTAAYEAMVRMAQPFSIRYPLVDGHGNFGSVDGDSAAAMRYTEARMTPIALELLRDIDKNTVDFTYNFDETLKEPTVLPSKIPNLLVNGSSGIAVGMATNIPPHNLSETIDGVVRLIEDPEVSIEGLMECIKGPDFPTGGIIMGRSGIKDAFTTGRGSVLIRSKVEIEEMSGGKSQIIVTEIPYQVNKARLVQKIGELQKEKKIDGMTDLRDESDRNGMRIVIELRRDVNPQVFLNKLFKLSQLEQSFGIIMLALVDGQPRVLNLKEILFYYLEHQKDVIVRRTKFDLEKAEKRAHILEGLLIALLNIDEVVEIIKTAPDTKTAGVRLMERFNLTEAQTQAILEMRLRTLTGLERDKIDAEYKTLMETIDYLRKILGSDEMVLQIIKEELLEIKRKYGDGRRTAITRNSESLEEEDLIDVQDIVITMTKNGYIKRLPLETYRNQQRGGKGLYGMKTKETDWVTNIVTTTTHHWLLLITNKGIVHKRRAYEIPEAGRTAKGTAAINIIPITGEEKVSAVIPIERFDDNKYLFFACKKGNVKRTKLTEYENIRKTGIIGIALNEDDEIIGVKSTDPSKTVLLVTKNGYCIRFQQEEVTPAGRVAKGVKGIDLRNGDEVISMDLMGADEVAEVLVVTELGFGKRTDLKEYKIQNRNGKGFMTAVLKQKTGKLADMKIVRPGNEVMLITAGGIIIRTGVDTISKTSRATQGVILMKTDDEDMIVAAAIIDNDDSEQLELPTV